MTRLRLAPTGPNVELPSFGSASNANVGAVASIDWSKAPSQTLTLTADCDVSSLGLPAGEQTWLQVIVVQATSGGHVPNFLLALTPGGDPLELTSGAGAIDVVNLFWNGTFLLATVGGNDFQ